MARLVYVTIAIAVLIIPLAMGCDSGGGSKGTTDASMFPTGGTGGGGYAGVGGTGGVKPATGGTGGVKPTTGGTGGGTVTPICGDNIRNGTEECDGADLGGATCATMVGAGSTGTVSCTLGCVIDDTQCVTPDTGVGGYGA